MANKQKPCSLAPKHSWAFVTNVKFTRASHGPTSSRVSMSLRGKYRCACGEVKYAAPAIRDAETGTGDAL